MGNDLNRNKPANPAPPLNALKSPEVKPQAKKERPVRRSVYDEIAERRKREKHKIGVSSGSSEAAQEIKFRFGDEISDIIDEVKHSREEDEANQNREEDDVKVYNPEKRNDSAKSAVEENAEIEEFPTDIYSDDGEEPPIVDDEENYDVPPIPKAPRRVGMWVAVISALSVLCVIAAGAYGLVNGYFDGIISLL